MSERVAEAAGRLIEDGKTANPGYFSPVYEGSDHCPDSDAYDVARWALPFFDAEPLTEEWLRSVQPRCDYTDTILNFAEFPIPCSGMCAGSLEFRRSGEVHLFGCVLAVPPKTRGELLRLAAGLKIELKGEG